MAQKLELAAVLEALRGELNIAKREGDTHDLRFQVDNLEVELQTVVERKAAGEAGGKVRFWVLDADTKASGEHKDAVTQKIKLTLKVVDTSKPAVDGKSPLAQVGGDS
jgi:hypothetical protein